MTGRSYVFALSCMDALAQRETGREVTIAGRAVVAAGKLQTSAFDVTIEDGTAGIRVFSWTLQLDVKEGDGVVASRLDAAITARSPEGQPYVVTASVGASPLDPALPLGTQWNVPMQNCMPRRNADARARCARRRWASA